MTKSKRIMEAWTRDQDVIREVSGSNVTGPGPGPGQQTITLTLTSPAPGNSVSSTSTSGGQPGLSTSSSIGLSSATPGLSGLAAVSSTASTAATASHGPSAVHYGGPPISTPSLQGSIQSKVATTQNYVVSSGPPPLNSICGTTDSGDEGLPVSVHVSNQMSSGPGGPEPPPGAGPEQGGHQTGTQSEQRLKVEDALNYLDQVKYKFGNQPQVYNDFLDIMKEFKSQSIDTPGVIARVSHLFRGHPELIVGFNTFLPPGYKIEVQTNDQVSLSMIGQGGGYVVTTVQTGIVPSASGNSAIQPTSSIIQHNVPGLPIRSSVTHPPQGTTQSVFASASVNNGRNSPPPPPSNLASSTNSFETGGTSTFTHSFSSPFVQSAFPSLQSQPVEFNHAINYVNKIKNRFQGQPDKYKQFLEILHTYQKEQRNIKEGLPPSSKHLTEHEVYSQVAKLFENQEDLLQEFGQFLPDATNHQNTAIKNAIDQAKKSAKLRDFPAGTVPQASKAGIQIGAPKRPTLQPTQPNNKKIKLSSSFKDITLAEAGKYGTLNEFAFFDKVRQSLKSQDVYDNFLRCLSLFNEEIVSRTELLQLVTPFLSKLPELYAWFKDFVGHNETAAVPAYEPIPQGVAKQEKLTEEQAMEIDFSTCKRLGASYCALPKNHIPPKCSGRTPLCKEVLNDVWVSFPTWSEDSTFITSRKTQFEEYIYRCEDERFELDVVIETNASTIRVLEAVAKKMSRMSPEELQEFHLDECMGGTSPTIHQRAVRRLYGDKAVEIIDGLKKHPAIAVPLVLRRLKAKEEEWREAQKGFNKIWREQIERFYLKSLDHQGITFKQGDIRALRSKALINEIETLYDERHEQNNTELECETVQSGPHLSLLYRDRTILDDACNLLLHHVRRQSSIHKDDKRRIKQILKHFIPDLFHHPRMDLSDDENNDDGGSPDEQDGRKTPNEYLLNGTRNGNKRNGASKRGNGSKQGTAGGKKDTGDDSRGDTHVAGSNLSGGSCQDYNTSSNYPVKGAPAEAQESRRTLAKRELKQMISESGRSRDISDVDRSHDDFNPASTSAAACSKDRSISHGEIGEPETDKHRPRRIIPSTDLDEAYALYYVNNCWYVFLRLHQILCERLTRMYETAANILSDESKDSRDSKSTAAIVLRLKPRSEVEVEEYYPTFLEMVRSLLDGNMESNVYEDTLREMFGIHAYIAYTMDKVVANAVRQLQTLVTDDMCQRCLELFQHAQRRGGSGGLCATSHQRVGAEISYQKKAEKAFAEENCVKVMIYKKQVRMTMELLECEPPPSRVDVDERAKWSSYVEKFVKPGEHLSDDLKRELYQKPVFLPRNIRKWKKQRQQAYLHDTKDKSVGGKKLNDSNNEQDDDDDDDDDALQIDDTDILDQGKDSRRVNILEIEIKDDPDKDRRSAASGRDKIHSNMASSSKQNTGSEEVVIKEEMDVEEMERLLLAKSRRRGTASDYIIEDNLQCQFNPNSFKMVFVVNSENFIYLKGALKRARETHKQVSLKLNDAFGKWHQTWIEENVTEDQITRCEDWLLSSKTSMTRIISNNDLSKAPYRPVNRYKVLCRRVSAQQGD